MSTEQFIGKPDMKISVKQTFGFDSEMQVDAFSKRNEHVPKLDSDYTDIDKRCRPKLNSRFSPEERGRLTWTFVDKLGSL